MVTGEVEWAIAAGVEANGMATAEAGDLWLTATAAGTLTRLSNNGILMAALTVNTGPTAVAVDNTSKIWVVGATDSLIARIDPVYNQSNFQKELVDAGGHDAAGDMIGTVVRTITSHYGTWSVVYDSLLSGTAWGTVSWTGSTPQGTSIEVRVRSSTDEQSWSSWETATDGQPLSSTPLGRYLEIEVALQRVSGSDSPVLDELSVVPDSDAVVSMRRGGGRIRP
jgi:streptogramin lyase